MGYLNLQQECKKVQPRICISSVGSNVHPKICVTWHGWALRGQMSGRNYPFFLGYFTSQQSWTYHPKWGLTYCILVMWSSTFCINLAKSILEEILEINRKNIQVLYLIISHIISVQSILLIRIMHERSVGRNFWAPMHWLHHQCFLLSLGIDRWLLWCLQITGSETGSQFSESKSN